MYHQAILLGILTSLFYTELTGFSAGLVIPGYLVLNLSSPLRILYTLLLAAAAAGLCRLLARGVILYGRRRFAAVILITFFLSALVDAAGILPGGTGVIGYLVPGIIAREMDRQGLLPTLLSLLITTGILALLLLMLGFPVGR